ncbi:MAG TPA: MSMEG_1061 family FMN-dependent PPOX-type flavoprotein [Streptomyces sp.]|uniref:MSMEG_1061 family FMN-dependent PPOX-type flavoprotein n=1 Tax=Streptomyces sp. TaxID=1931 RepID=UPI002C125AA5|nr:MSMEG_1061 family FMN-dependent PPOX-type flavoprotein [Streptomyces sp.]HWU05128.1 MSMEG_1061 family FMN-dependent PPOX-type flavoprotein [Streptomyces sp.]
MSNAAPVAATAYAPSVAGDPLAGAVPLRSAEQLREILGEPWPIVIDKVHDELTEGDLDLLARAPFCAVSTSDADGNCDTSPRGGAPGFTRVLDSRTLALPDLPGNRRGDSFHNILSNPHVGLLYLIPGVMTVLRINGRARILTDAPFFDGMAVKGRRPDLALVVEIDEIYLHCSASLKRSGVWAPRTWEGASEEA